MDAIKELTVIPIVNISADNYWLLLGGKKKRKKKKKKEKKKKGFFNSDSKSN